MMMTAMLASGSMLHSAYSTQQRTALQAARAALPDWCAVHMIGI
jgi:hypothetical protein